MKYIFTILVAICFFTSCKKSKTMCYTINKFTGMETAESKSPNYFHDWTNYQRKKTSEIRTAEVQKTNDSLYVDCRVIE